MNTTMCVIREINFRSLSAKMFSTNALLLSSEQELLNKENAA
jgi:hypothetical protein